MYLAKLREEADYRARGTPAIGWIIQANNQLYRSYSDDGSIAEFAQALVIHGPGADEIDPFVAELARRVASLKDTTPDDPDLQRVAEWVTDEKARPEVRHRLPESLTEGREAYLVHVFVYRKWLPGKTLSHPFVRVLMIWNEPTKWPHMVSYHPGDDAYRIR
jgi:hypothetical protein